LEAAVLDNDSNNLGLIYISPELVANVKETMHWQAGQYLRQQVQMTHHHGPVQCQACLIQTAWMGMIALWSI
jgi:hypothetical protein